MSDNLIIECESAALHSEVSEADLVGSDSAWQSIHFLLKTQSIMILLKSISRFISSVCFQKNFVMFLQSNSFRRFYNTEYIYICSEY